MQSNNNDDEFTKKTSISNPGTLFSSENKEKPLNPILDIPKIPFDAKKHQEILKLEQNGATCKLEKFNNFIWLHDMHAPKNKPGSGYGAAKFREIVNESIKEECPGKINCTAYTTWGSPHLFYLYMGMAPNPREYVKTKFGNSGNDFFKELSKLKEWNEETLEKLLEDAENPIAFYMLSEILKDGLKLPSDYNVSLDDIIKNKELILSYKDKMFYSYKEDFIPDLLKILEKNPQSKYPETRSLGNIGMHLTEKGFERWKFVIENKLEFVPFKHFEHLDLSTEQQKKLDEVLGQRSLVRKEI